MPTANQRLRDFAKRKRGNRHVVEVADRDWEYIPIHPCADETILLAELDYSPESCTSVDFYWRCGPDVAFVQIHAQPYAPNRDPGIYARRAENGAYLFNIVAVLASQVVLLRDLRMVQERCVALGFLGDAFSSAELGETLGYVGGLAEGAA